MKAKYFLMSLLTIICIYVEIVIGNITLHYLQREFGLSEGAVRGMVVVTVIFIIGQLLLSAYFLIRAVNDQKNE